MDCSEQNYALLVLEKYIKSIRTDLLTNILNFVPSVRKASVVRDHSHCAAHRWSLRYDGFFFDIVVAVVSRGLTVGWLKFTLLI